MAKRKAVCSSDEGTDGYIPTESDEYEPIKPMRRRSTGTTKSKKRTRRDPSQEHQSPGPSQSRLYPHSKNLHVIRSAGRVQVRLLQWYSAVSEIRGMPWRKKYDPTLSSVEKAQRAYEVWVSEIMLQQTQVNTVIPYYNRWMKKFPSVRDLAAASIDEVNSLWKGLGYYSRASRLLTGAQKVVQDFHGKLPDNAKEMQEKIPGIGRYSAGAISSIAYGERVPVLDGNVHRLLSRVLALHSPPKAKATLEILWNAATAMVQVPNTSGDGEAGDDAQQYSPRYPGDINQALIELGSTICKVTDPKCGECPIKDNCLAYSRQHDASASSDVPSDIEDICDICLPLDQGLGVTAYPMKAEKKKQREEVDLVTVIEWRSGGRSSDRYFLLRKRPKHGLLAGLYEFPTQENIAGPFTEGKLDALMRKQLADLVLAPIDYDEASESSSLNDDSTLRVRHKDSIGDVVHIFSHIRKIYKVWWLVLEGGKLPPPLGNQTKDIALKPARKTRSEKGTGTGGTANKGAGSSARWIPMEEVDDTNIGTGVVKIWKLVKQAKEPS